MRGVLGRGWRRCTVALAEEHEAAARVVLGRHAAVEPGTVRFAGGHLSWSLDLASLPEGDGPAVEEVIRREIERAAKP